MHNLKAERFYKQEMVNGMMMAHDGMIKTFPLRGIKDSHPYLHDGRCGGILQPHSGITTDSFGKGIFGCVYVDIIENGLSPTKTRIIYILRFFVINKDALNFHTFKISKQMNNLFKGLISGYGAYKLGGGCLSTIVIFVVIWLILGHCS
jgi:hypothetical protein